MNKYADEVQNLSEKYEMMQDNLAAFKAEHTDILEEFASLKTEVRYCQKELAKALEKFYYAEKEAING